MVNSASTAISAEEVVRVVNSGGWEIVRIGLPRGPQEEEYRYREIRGIEYDEDQEYSGFRLGFRRDHELWVPNAATGTVAVLRTVEGVPTRIKVKGPCMAYMPRPRKWIEAYVKRRSEHARATPLLRRSAFHDGPDAPLVPTGIERFPPLHYAAGVVTGNVLVLRHPVNYEAAQLPYKP